MRRSLYSTVAAVLLVTNFERTRSMLDSCSNCPAGTFCGKNKDQTCVLCPPNSYSSTLGQMVCSMCRRCEGVFRTRKPCSRTSNTECECAPGLRCLGPGCPRCYPDCAQGQELTEDGCKDCYFGTFNDKRGGECQPWTKCSLDGKTVLVNGTKERDVVCGPVPADFSPAFVKPVQTAQMEDACSCRFPQEEEGEFEL
ncbi:tumor necrosis factor receptor superfamily member 9 isoform X2 [Fukomys damarensis]|uniref:tumor necrosis factor receptor superfamily member 9 isoform X2 n=1 Tax=Fukomys damarensis TaxID=885580 RepID=UPI0014556D52|nr:tumor necrosis factor receptor superfamily member 9 isoform X2 [Fukomys damarensis]